MKELPFWVQILNQSIAASLVIAVVFVVRLLMKRFPKKYSFCLWLIVGIRLVCPVFVSSPFSMFNLDQNHYLNTYISTADTQKLQEKPSPLTASPNLQAQNAASLQPENTPIQKSTAKETKKEPTQESSNHSIRFYGAATIYLTGIFGILGWNFYLVLRMRRKLQKAVLYHGASFENNKASRQSRIYESDCIASPFVLGLFRPSIYIPFRLHPEELSYILKHEQYHISRKDYLTKFLAFLITVFYWFNPLVWAAYLGMTRDMEMSCDEHVLTELGEEIKTDYSKSLLAFATNQRRFSMGMLAFGETDTRRRVKNIMRFKKTRKWMGVFSITIILLLSMVCLTNKQAAEPLEKKEEVQTKPALSSNALTEIIAAYFLPLPIEPIEQVQNPHQRMNPERILFLNGKFYYGTTETGPMGDADCVAGYITSSVTEKEIPTQNGESNFGCVGNPYTRDDDDGWIQVFLEDGEYHIFVTDTLESENDGWIYLEENQK